MADKTT